MKPLRIYNTLSRQKEEFKPIESEHVKIYACGQTVYDKATIGNFRTYIFEDILRRVLKYNSYDVNFVQNITDVGHLIGDRDMGEDKLAVSAARQGVNAWELAKKLEEDFFEDAKKLNIERPDIVCRATEHIQEQIGMIKELEDKGFTYKTSDGIYFDTSKVPDYGKLAHLDKAGLQEGARVEVNHEKRNPTDFALWKFSPKDEKRQMEWESPWGTGFPGWHIECSAMSIKYLGVPFDIHAGGIDHIPVHHTNEIAQNEAIYGHQTVNYWLHGGFLLIDGGRMGKSLGNAYTLQDIVDKGVDPLAYRYLTFTAHYRQELNFTWESLDSASKAYTKLIAAATYMVDTVIDNKGALNKEFNERFYGAINDDLNMPKALAIVWEMIGSNIPDEDKFATLVKFDAVLGLSIKQKTSEFREGVPIPEDVGKLKKERDEARKNREFEKSDQLRKIIESKGYIINDSPDGSEIYRS